MIKNFAILDFFWDLCNAIKFGNLLLEEHVEIILHVKTHAQILRSELKVAFLFDHLSLQITATILALHVL